MSQNIIIRPMQETDMEGAMRLSSAAGWNQTEKDWTFILTHPGNICLTVTTGEKIIATTAAINYSGTLYWIGMVLVDEHNRGHGLGKLLLTAVLEKLPATASVKLDATPQGEPVYKKFAFKEEYSIARMVHPRMQPMPAAGNDCLPEPVQPHHLQEIISLDAAAFGASRAPLLHFLAHEYPGKAWLIKRDEKITGFVLGRDGCRYHHVGPVIATGTTDVKTLVTSVLNQLTNQPVVVDVPYDKPELMDWLKEAGFSEQRHFTRMYQKENLLPGIAAKQFLICGPEFG